MDISVDKISVIVPVYKVEEYLDECVESILRQSYSNFELILVDDGSPDRCGEMCDNYKKRDARIEVIHKTNGGLSDARNAGLRVASGEYITFVDSDDTIADNYLEILYKALKKYGVYIVQGEATEIIENIGKKRKKPEVVYTRNEAIECFLQQKTVEAMACAKLYKRHCFVGIEYPKGRINEDNLTTYKNIWRANAIACIPEYIYFYRINENGIMKSSLSAKRFEILSFQDEVEAFLEADAVAFKKSIDYAEMRIAVRLINDCIMEQKEVEFNYEMTCAKKVIKEYCLDKAVCEVKYGCIVWMIKNSYWLYRTIVRWLR